MPPQEMQPQQSPHQQQPGIALGCGSVGVVLQLAQEEAGISPFGPFAEGRRQQQPKNAQQQLSYQHLQQLLIGIIHNTTMHYI